MSPEDRDKVLQRIRKCLALGSSPNEHEAAAGMRQAQKLMEMHGLSQADLDNAAIKEERAAATAWRNVPVWEHMLAWTIADAFGVALYLEKSAPHARELSAFVFYGPEHRALLAKYAHEVLSRQVLKARAKFVRETCPGMSRSTCMDAGESYAQGFVSRLKEKVDIVAPTQSEARGMELRAKELGLAPLKDRRSKGGDTASYMAGLADGANASLHRPMNGGEARLQLT